MISINVVDFGQDLSGRATAIQCRQRVLKLLQEGEVRVSVNFSGVRTVSESFADELFGVLVASCGEEWFRQKLKLDGLNPDVRLTILAAIQSRIERQHEDHQPVCH